jgi:formate hydrogenlyase transcriptional activator
MKGCLFMPAHASANTQVNDPGNDSALKYRALTEISEAFLGSRDCDALFRGLWDSLGSLIRFDFLLLMLIDEQTRSIRVETMAGEPPLDVPVGRDYPVEGTPSGLAWKSQAPLYIPNVALETRFRPDIMSDMQRYQCQSGLWVPLTTVRRRLGSMVFASREIDPYTAEDREFLHHVARHVAIAVENALAFEEINALRQRIEEEKVYLEEEIRSEQLFGEIIGASPALRHVLEQIENAAPTDSTVLIQGETGTGKELIARAIHQLSHRSQGTFVKLNCSAIPAGLLESELMGHEKGAFTGAISQRLGRVELASKGTLFLDEVGDLPLELQPKLLRVLQDGQFERLGSSKTMTSDFRLVAATNRDLRTLAAEQQFRMDLFYRLSVFPITAPPLRERREDIPILVRHFVQDFAARMRKPIDSIPTEAMEALVNYPWPGNVRELRNVVERSVILSSGKRLEIPKDALHQPLSEPSSVLRMTEAERRHILEALNASNWTVGGPRGAATLLGLKRSTLQSKMERLGIKRRYIS